MPLFGDKKRHYEKAYKRILRAKLSDRERRAIRINVSLDSCSHCDWHGICDMHHLDRDRSNNRADNIAILCPNCHRDIHTCGLRGSNDGIEGV